jgi:AcrR family transcriptional regulator
VNLKGETQPQTRRRGQELDDAILDAAWIELQQNGYAGLTYEKVAARAGTSRPVVYRRWPLKTELAIATIRYRGSLAAQPGVDTGTLRGDVLAQLTRMGRHSGENILAFLGNAGELFRETGLTPDQVREQWLGDRSLEQRTILDRAADRGEIDRRRITPRTVRLPGDLLRNQMLMTMGAVSEEWIEQIVDEVVMPVYLAPVPDAEEATSRGTTS